MQIDKLISKNGYIIVEPLKEHTKTLTSGLVLVEKNKWDDLSSGTVKVISEDAKLANEVSIGDKVFFFEKDVKSKFTLEKKEYFNIKDVDLLAYEKS